MNILIVDDSEAMREIIKWNLRLAAVNHNRIYEACCYVDALHIVETRKLSLVIADWNMPEMGGLRLLRTLRETHNSIQFGFVVTQTSNKIRDTAHNAGADFIISDPSNINVFKTQVDHVF